MNTRPQNMPNRKVRFAVVGLGWIAQEAVLPAFQNVETAELAALVTNDSLKANELGKQYGVPRTCSYQEYDDLLRRGEVDAVYISLPNSMHKDYSVRALRAGVHVLCEKPMAETAEECHEMIRAAEENNVKLMVAYRLHFEPANLRAIEIIRSGEIGEPRIFMSAFCQQVGEGNVRLKKSLGGGPLMDMGVYPINAARYLFREEPLEVIAFGGNNGEPRFEGIHEMVSGVMRFPGDRLASITCSLGSANADAFEVLGTKGSLRLLPAYDYHTGKTLTVTIGDRTREEKFSHYDQFGAEIAYLSRCILEGKDPEPSGHEGLADVRVIQALLRSIRTGSAVRLGRYEREKRPDQSQAYELPPVHAREIVHAEPPSAGVTLRR